jgi:hypothetical protein
MATEMIWKVIKKLRSFMLSRSMDKTANLNSIEVCDFIGKNAVSDVIQQQLGRRPEQVKVLPTYSNSIVCEAYFPNSTVIFKTVRSGKGSAIAIEGWAYERVRELGVPVPKVLSLDTSRQFFPTIYIILEKLTGKSILNCSWLSSGQLRTLLREKQDSTCASFTLFGWRAMVI